MALSPNTADDPNSVAALNRVIEALTNSTSQSQSRSSDNQQLVGLSGGNNNNSNSSNFLTPFASLNDFDLNNDFGSSSANLEYAVLSSMLQNSGYGNFSPNSFATAPLPALSMDSLSAAAGNPYGNADFPALQTGYSDTTSQVSPPDAFFNGSSASQPTPSSSNGHNGRSHSASNANGNSAFSFNQSPYDTSYLANSSQPKGEVGGTSFLSSEVASLFGALGQDQLSQSPVQIQDQYGQQQPSSRPQLQHYDSNMSQGSHHLTPQSDTFSTPHSQQQPLPQQQHQESQSSQRSAPLSNPNGGSLTSTKSFSSALDWNNSKPSGGLPAPAGPSRALPQRQVSFATFAKSSQRSQNKQNYEPQQSNQRAYSGQASQSNQQFQKPQAPTQGGSKPVRTSSKPLISSTGVMRVEDVYKYVNKPYVGDLLYSYCYLAG